MPLDRPGDKNTNENACASPTSPSRTAEAHPGLSQGGKVVPVLGRGRAKDGDNRILHSPPLSSAHRRLHRSQHSALRTMGRCPCGGLVQSPAGPGDSPHTPDGAPTKNGVGRLPREEAADAVVKK